MPNEQGERRRSQRHAARNGLSKFALPTQMKVLFWRKQPFRKKGFEVVHVDPHVYLIHDFVTEAEIDHIDLLVSQHSKQLTGKRGRSYTESTHGEKLISSHRTSTFLYIRKFADGMIRRIEDRGANITGVPALNVEPLQVVSYTNGQHFGIHHDLGTLKDDGTVVQPEAGTAHRLTTLFVYLNSLPEDAGGATYFPKLGIEVRPRKGCALLFCNVNRDGSPDTRVVHEARAVSAGFRKFGMNLWVTSASMIEYALSSSGIANKECTKRHRGIKGIIASCDKERESLIGENIEVEWEDNVWYEAKVVEFQPKLELAKVVYTESQTEESIRITSPEKARSPDGTCTFKWRLKYLQPKAHSLMLVEWKNLWYVGKVLARNGCVLSIFYESNKSTEQVRLLSSGKAVSADGEEEVNWKLLKRDKGAIAYETPIEVEWSDDQWFVANVVGYDRAVDIYTLLYKKSRTVEKLRLSHDGGGSSPDGEESFRWRLVQSTPNGNDTGD